MTGLEGVYRSSDSLKRRLEVKERLDAGVGEKQIAADLGISHHAVTEIIASLREEGAEAPTRENP